MVLESYKTTGSLKRIRGALAVCPTRGSSRRDADGEAARSIAESLGFHGQRCRLSGLGQWERARAAEERVVRVSPTDASLACTCPRVIGAKGAPGLSEQP